MENDMRTLILYTTTYGYTQEIVDEMKKRIPDATAINLQKTTEVNLETYDSVILGGAIYVGKVHKNLIEFAKTHENALLKKELRLFLCCAFEANFNEEIITNFPARLIEHASSIENFGGKLQVEKMNFAHKMMVKMISKTPEGSKPILTHPERIETFLR